MIINHYGITVNSEVPVTGVFQNNRVPNLFDDFLSFSKTIDLRVERIIEEKFPDEPSTDDIENLEDLLEELLGFIQTYNQEESFFWFPKRKIGYKPDPNSEFSCIIGESTTQVVASKWITLGSLCSPCYPGQVDTDSLGEFQGFCFPKELEYHFYSHHQILPIEGKLYRIHRSGPTGEDEYWSIPCGWRKNVFTAFTEKEKSDFKLNLPQEENWQTYRMV